MHPRAPHQSQRLRIVDGSQVGEARRAATVAARAVLHSETAIGRAAICATELATNLLRHANGGDLLIRECGDAPHPYVELLAIDSGPGMHNAERCLSDGYSTGGSPGNGLGAMRRLALEFDLYSAPGQGTVVMARIGDGENPGRLRDATVSYGAICIPITGETVTGDGWTLRVDAQHRRLIVVDGLGHGIGAAAATQAALEGAAASKSSSSTEALQAAHQRMTGTRGGAVAVATIEGRSLRFAGVGNIGATVVGAQQRGLMSHNGTAGTPMFRAQEFSYDWSPDSFLVMHSDGLSARWQLEKFPGLFMRHPAVIAGVLFREYARGRDDATVVVLAGRS